MDDSDAQQSFQPYFDELIAFATTEAKKPDLLAGKAEYAQLTGEVFEDDKQFEMRMASFLDYYLFDRPGPLTGKTPAMELYEERLQAAPTSAGCYRAFTETIHGLFEVRKLGKGLVRIREVFSAKDHEVTERRQLAGLAKGDLLEARLVPYNGHLLFSAAFCCHPRAAIKLILKEVKRRKKKEPTRSPRELVFECSKRALKVDRYQQIAVEKIYEFVNPRI